MNVIKLLNQLKWILVYCAAIYLLTIIYLYFFADRMIFHPPRPASYVDSKQIIKLKTADGETISAIYLPNPNSQFVILYSHGNAADIGQTLPYLIKLRDLGFSVFTYDYHGYGTSTGKPSEKNTYQDIDAAYNYLTQTLQITPQHIITYGQSLGAAVAIDLTIRKPIGGLIIESPFVSAFRTVTYLPLFPFDRFNNLAKISQVKRPILFIHGEKDNVISIWHSKKLYSVAKSPKYYLWLPNMDHNQVAQFNTANEQQALQQFMQQVKQ